MDMRASNRRHVELTVYRGLAPPSERARAARLLCRQASSIDDPLALERFVSSLLGRLWERCEMVPDSGGVDPMRVLGEPIVDSVVEAGGLGGKLFLTALAQIERGALGLLAAERAASIPEVPVPDWVTQVGTASIVRAFSTYSPGDGEALMLASRTVGGTDHMVAVFIADRLGGIAKHLWLTRLFDPSDPSAQADLQIAKPLDFRPVDHALACQRVRIAIDRSDAAPIGWVGPDFADHRALSIARITPLPLRRANDRRR